MCLTEYDEAKVLHFQYEDGKDAGIETDKRNVILALYQEGMSLDFIVKIVKKDISEIRTILIEHGALKI